MLEESFSLHAYLSLLSVVLCISKSVIDRYVIIYNSFDIYLCVTSILVLLQNVCISSLKHMSYNLAGLFLEISLLCLWVISLLYVLVIPAGNLMVIYLITMLFIFIWNIAALKMMIG